MAAGWPFEALAGVPERQHLCQNSHYQFSVVIEAEIQLLGDSVLNNRSMSVENETAEAKFVCLRAEGLLFALSPCSLPAHFARNAQAFTERAYRLGAVASLGLLRSVVFPENREFSTRMMHLALRGMSRDLLDLLGEEYFNYVVQPRIRQE